MVVMLAILTVAYFKRTRTLSGTRRAVSGARQFSFYAAIFVLAVEPLTPLSEMAERSFTAHMLEHLTIGDFAALLMVLGLTGPLIQPLLKNPVIAALRPLAHPVAAFVLWVANMYFWHFPAMMGAAIDNDYVHVLQHMFFFAAGFNMWLVLFGPLPQPAWFGNIAKLLYFVGVRAAGVLLGNFFVFSGSAYYSQYEVAENPFGLSPLADQSTAGAVMMAEGTIVSFILFAWLFWRAAREGEESQQLIELAEEHGVELSGDRSARAAAAGTTDLLRERITSAADKDSESVRPPS